MMRGWSVWHNHFCYRRLSSAAGIAEFIASRASAAVARCNERSLALARKQWSALGLWAVIISLGNLGTLRAAQLPSALECLPEQTFFMVRVPQATAIVQHFRGHTRLGKTWTDPDRWSDFFDLAWPAQRKSFVASLPKYKLEGIGWPQLGRGEAGCALVSTDEGKGVLTLFWIEPDTAVADRLATAAGLLVDEWTRQNPTVKRVNVDFPDATLTMVTWAEKPSALEVVEKLETARAAKTEATRKDDPNDKSKPTDPDWDAAEQPEIKNVFFLRIGNRLVLAQHEWIVGEDRTVEETSRDLQACREILSQFVAAHRKGDGEALAKFESLPGISARRPAGEPIVEAFLDPSTPLFWITELLKEDEDDKELNELIKASAIEDLKAISYRATFDQNLVRAEVSLAVAKPRRGVWQALDQSPLPPIDQNWIPADAVTVTQVSVDVAKLYRQLLDATAHYLEADKTVEKALRLPIPFLASLGKRFTLVGFAGGRGPGRAMLPHATDKKQGDNPLGRQRQALVATVHSPELWQFGLQCAELLDGGQRVSEQGFEGLRFDSCGVRGGLFVGNGWLVVGIGDELAEGILSLLEKRPTDQQAFIRSPGFRRACELLPPEPAIFYQFTDDSRPGEMPGYWLWDGLLGLAEIDIADLLKAAEINWLEQIATVFPARDFAGTLGVTVHQATVTEHGLKVRAVTELARP